MGTTIEDVIIEKVRDLPAAQKEEVLQFVYGLDKPVRRPFRSPKGTLSDSKFVLTEEDLAQARREMWCDFTRNDIS